MAGRGSAQGGAADGGMAYDGTINVATVVPAKRQNGGERRDVGRILEQMGAQPAENLRRAQRIEWAQTTQGGAASKKPATRPTNKAGTSKRCNSSGEPK